MRKTLRKNKRDNANSINSDNNSAINLSGNSNKHDIWK